mmetsp:Transcript_973/g.2650  ORF Transcript_973/g.2650 Transcript_973/m.2650 type:complete len:203 (+) Transcript_973:1042-1650(+)
MRPGPSRSVDRSIRSVSDGPSSLSVTHSVTTSTLDALTWKDFLLPVAAGESLSICFVSSFGTFVGLSRTPTTSAISEDAEEEGAPSGEGGLPPRRTATRPPLLRGPRESLADWPRSGEPPATPAPPPAAACDMRFGEDVMRIGLERVCRLLWSEARSSLACCLWTLASRGVKSESSSSACSIIESSAPSAAARAPLRGESVW